MACVACMCDEFFFTEKVIVSFAIFENIPVRENVSLRAQKNLIAAKLETLTIHHRFSVALKYFYTTIEASCGLRFSIFDLMDFPKYALISVCM